VATETAEQRKARLVGIARAVIARDGVAGCTFRRLAAAAGTSTRPFTHAFGTRENLLREVADSLWENGPIDRDAGAGAVDDVDDCVEELIAIGEQWLPLNRQQSVTERIYMEIVLHALKRPALHAALRRNTNIAAARAEELIAAGQARGQIRAGSASDLAIAFWVLHAGMTFEGIHKHDVLTPETMRRIWRDAVERLLRP
jgi:AcrR family transcriptional regulator